MLASGLPAIFNFLALVLYTRLLSPDEYGKYALVITGVGMANTVFFWWLRLGLLRFALYHENQQQIFLSTLAASFVGAIALTGLMGVGMLIFSPYDSILFQQIALSLGLLWTQAWFELNLELLRSRLAPLRYGLLSTTKAVLALVLGAGFTYSGFGAKGIVAGLMIATLIAVCSETFRSWRKVSLSFVDTKLVRKLLAFGIPLGAKFVLDFSIIATGRFSLAALQGTSATGVYSASFDLAQQTIGVLVTIVYLGAYPLVITTLEKDGPEAARHQLADYATLLFAIALPATVGIALLSSNIARIFLGQAFSNLATDIIPWIALAAFLSSFKAHYLDLSFQLGSNTVAQIWIGFASAASCVLLNFLLIPEYGIVGAAYATVLAYVISAILSWSLGKAVFRFPKLRAEDGKIALATLMMCAALWPFLDHKGIWQLVGQIGLGGLVYGAALVGFDVFNLRTSLKQWIKGCFPSVKP